VRGFRACEISRQGATATPTTVLLSPFRRPSRHRGGSEALLTRAGWWWTGQTRGGGYLLPAQHLWPADVASHR
jgi:hypothetical protein